MLIARVIGDITSTQKHASHEGSKILLVQPVELDGARRGNPVVALDSVQAGIGDTVLLVQDGYAAMTAIGKPQSPIDAAVIAVIDQVDVCLEAPPVTPAKKSAQKKNS